MMSNFSEDDVNRAPAGTFATKNQGAPEVSIDQQVKVGEPDGFGDRVLELAPGGVIRLSGLKDEFWHDQTYDWLTVEHAGTHFNAFATIEGVDLTEFSNDSATFTSQPSLVADLIAGSFDGGWLDDEWESDPSNVRLNVPIRLDAPPFNGGTQLVSTNELMESINPDIPVGEAGMTVFASALAIAVEAGATRSADDEPEASAPRTPKVLAHNTAFSGPNSDIPVITEEDGSYLVDDIENWHEASDAERDLYEKYWDEQPD